MHQGLGWLVGLVVLFVGCSAQKLPVEMEAQGKRVTTIRKDVERLQGATFVFLLQQKGSDPGQFRARLRVSLPEGAEVEATTFRVTGYAEDGPTEAGVGFDGNLSGGRSRFKTGWIRSSEPGEEVCYLFTGDYRDSSDNEIIGFRYSECVQMDELFPPAEVKVLEKSYQPPFAESLVLKLELNPERGARAIADFGYIYDETPVLDEEHIRGYLWESEMFVYTDTGDPPKDYSLFYDITALPSRERRMDITPYVSYLGGEFDQTCVDIRVVYDEWQPWDGYWETKVWQEELCSDEVAW